MPHCSSLRATLSMSTASFSAGACSGGASKRQQLSHIWIRITPLGIDRRPCVSTAGSSPAEREAARCMP